MKSPQVRAASFMLNPQQVVFKWRPVVRWVVLETHHLPHAEISSFFGVKLNEYLIHLLLMLLLFRNPQILNNTINHFKIALRRPQDVT